MKPRKVKDLTRVLTQKGFVIEPKKDHHEFFYLKVGEKKHNVYTFFSHGKKEYGGKLMGDVKKQLKFKDAEKAELFFDCPMTGEMYLAMLRENGDLSE